jgi:hypothetical protein
MKTYHFNADCVSSVSVHPSLPVLATASGQRHFTLTSDSDSSNHVENISDSDDEIEEDSTSTGILNARILSNFITVADTRLFLWLMPSAMAQAEFVEQSTVSTCCAEDSNINNQ